MSAAKRKENRLVRQVFAEIEPRDGDCRIATLPRYGCVLSMCGGPIDPVHLGEWRRSKTRKMAPEIRHNSRTILRGCRVHHDAYDAREFDIAYGPDGADGALAVVVHVTKGAAA
jgi:hypothetical protein